MLDKQTTIYLYRGATSSIKFDFSEFNFNGGKCVFTISNICKKTKLFQFEFTESKLYVVTIPDEFTAQLKDNQYLYNIMYILGEERFPECADSDVIVRSVVNGYE